MALAPSALKGYIESGGLRRDLDRNAAFTGIKRGVKGSLVDERALANPNPDLAELLKYNREGISAWLPPLCAHRNREQYRSVTSELTWWRCLDCGERREIDERALRLRGRP